LVSLQKPVKTEESARLDWHINCPIWIEGDISFEIKMLALKSIKNLN